jgi:hypothetical protein
MGIYVAPRDENPGLSRALIPKAEIAHLMRSGAKSKAVPAEVARELTRVHEAGHAVLATVLRGFSCELITIEKSMPSVKVAPHAHESHDGNEDLIDLAGLYAELRSVGDELGYCHAHLKNATYDLDNARSRLAGTSQDEIAWARKGQPLWEEAVAYFWPTIRALASQLPDTGRLDRQQVEHVVKDHRPTAATPEFLCKRIKAEYLVTRSSDDGASR